MKGIGELGEASLPERKPRLRRPAKSAAGIIRPILRHDLHLETTSRLARLIAAAEPGSRLPTERELCQRLGVGRSTVREALRSLSFVGAIQPRQGSGTYVAPVEDAAVDRLLGLGLLVQRSRVYEVIEARRILEVQAVRLAAERYQESDRRELVAVMQRMSGAISEPPKASRYDLQYHVLLARASHNSVLVHFINGMRGLLEMWIKRAVNRPAVIEEIVREHNQVLEAVFDRDADRAAELMAAHLSNAAERLFAVIGKDQSAADYIASLLADSR